MESIFSGAANLSLGIVNSLGFELIFCAACAASWFLTLFMKRQRTPQVAGKGKEHDPHVTQGVGESLEKKGRLEVKELAAQIAFTCKNRFVQAHSQYKRALKEGVDFSGISLDEAEQMYTALITSAIRMGRANEVPHLMRDVRHAGRVVSSALFSSATKLCTSKQFFSEALVAFDEAVIGGTLINDKSIWSCLIFCAVEANEPERCPELFRCLKECGLPSCKDYGNMIRCSALCNDWKAAMIIMKEMHELNVNIDNVVYNTALALCVNSQQAEAAEQILMDMEARGMADVITYNIVMKGHARAGNAEKVFEVHRKIVKQGFNASQVTFGILLDSCVNSSNPAAVSKVFDAMVEQGLPLNTVLCTTLIKGFARANEVRRAMEVYSKMRRDQSIQPDLVTFSILIKANCDNGQMEDALQLIDEMLVTGLKPDEIIFNNLLSGCVKLSKVALGKEILQNMTQANVQPTNATFSILLRLLSKERLLEEAVTLLQTMASDFQVEPEPRLYVQLIQACIRERQGSRALEVFRALTQRHQVHQAALSSILKACSTFNMFETASQLMPLIVQTQSHLSACDANALLGNALKRRKNQAVKAILVAMSALDLAVEPRLRPVAEGLVEAQ